MTDVMYCVSFFANEICAAACLWVILRYVFAKEAVRSKAAYCTFIALFAANAFLLTPFLAKYLYDFAGWADTVSVILLIASSYLLFRDRKQFTTLIAVIICDATVEMFFSLMMPYLPTSPWVEELFCAALHLAIDLLIVLAAKKTAVNVLPEVFSDIPKWIWAVLLLFELTCYYKEFGDAASWYGALYAVSSGAVILCVLYLIFKIFLLIRRQTGILDQLEKQRAFGEALQSGDEELRRFRHDYRNHMTVVGALLTAGRTDDAAAYLTALNAPVEGVMKKISTGNFVADAIINNKALEASRSGGAIVFDGVVPQEGVASEDLCTVLSNLLDNAIEAVRKNDDSAGSRTIRADAGVSSGYFHLKVANPVTFKTSRSLRTSKADKLNHGIGLRNVKRTAERRGGTLITTNENGRFTAEVSMRVES